MQCKGSDFTLIPQANQEKTLSILHFLDINQVFSHFCHLDLAKSPLLKPKTPTTMVSGNDNGGSWLRQWWFPGTTTVIPGGCWRRRLAAQPQRVTVCGGKGSQLDALAQKIGGEHPERTLPTAVLFTSW